MRDLSLSLKEYGKTQRMKEACAQFNWTAFDMELGKLDAKAASEPVGAVQAAAVAVELAPADEPSFARLSQDLFGITRPAIRFMLVAMLTAALMLTSVPVLARTFLLLFPVFKEDPDKWWNKARNQTSNGPANGRRSMGTRFASTVLISMT